MNKEEKLVIYTNGEEGFVPTYELSVLPRMRATDLVLLMNGVGHPGDVALYEGQFYSITGQYIRALPKSQVEALGLERSGS
jgi:hypothetical protein